MTTKLVWTPRARSDVKKIYIDIGKSQPLAAERYFARFRAKAERLVDHPHLGERHPEIFPSARMLVEAPYVILYETVPDTDGDEIYSVEIVRVIDGRRDLRTLF
ncbi:MULTISPECIES: type II toxin-antitoxin system RelE/ParE family toxin [Agrobacterium]|uniref:type II toxin-antitoxin system RelE/ParE family toxin n=1 Tax=Agrobacterium TaxID=357 RepID=UPI00115DB40E|nr:type II toxin-antitoxin system RelE/ParE family toxin [Agrobacterium sp. T29]MBW9073228.1 type II toxin-antitoxin system RelE/ParE family toxin [Agrobacterium deltaense]